jgi:hypothetical protein
MRQLAILNLFFLALHLSCANGGFVDSTSRETLQHDFLGGEHLNQLNLKVLSRHLQEDTTDQELFIPPCNTVLGTMSADELRTFANGLVIAIAPDPESFEYTYLQSTLVTPIQHGIQVHRICAGCQDVASQVQDDAEAAAVFETFCGRENYGAVNATFSGLMMVPMAEDDESILPGTLKGIIDMHPTAIAVVPSLMWTMQQSGEESVPVEGDSEEDFLLVVDAILAGTGQVMVFPDYMGYAENGDELYKGYTIQKAYQTSSIPIVLWAQEYLRQQTDCATALSTTVGVKGYSEGGYTAVVLADVLHRMGWNVVQVHAGGGPYDLIAATTKTFERIANGLYDTRFRHILALVGSSYSSTYVDLPNYQQNQDMLTEDIRPTLVELIANSTPEPIVRESMPFEDQTDLLQLLFNDEYLAFVNRSVSEGNFDPCGSTPREELEIENVDKICEAFQLNVIVETLQNAPFKVTVCHSADDEVVPVESVPDLSGNDNLVFVPAQGGHNEAGGECIFGALLYYLSSAFQSVSVDPIHSTTGCSASEGSESSPAETTSAPSDAASEPENSEGSALQSGFEWATLIVSVAALGLV